MPNLSVCTRCGSINRGFDNPGCMNDDCSNDNDVLVFLNSHGQTGVVGQIEDDDLEAVLNAYERDARVINEFSDLFLDVVGTEWGFNADAYVSPTLDEIEEYIEGGREVLKREEGFSDEELDEVKQEAQEHVEMWGEEQLKKLYEEIRTETVLNPYLDYGY